MGRVICIVFFFGIFTFLYKVYADYVTASFFTIKEKAVTMFKKANVREMPEGGTLPAAEGK
jgi:hypothetical protein